MRRFNRYTWCSHSTFRGAWAKATTSGTTGQPKYLPVTHAAARRSHRNISLIWLYYLARRNIGFLNDYLVAITGSPVEGLAPDGTPFGSAEMTANLR